MSRYDGQRFQSFTTQDGLADNRVISILQDREGDLWFGTWGGGVSRYDGQQFTTFTTQEGLADNRVYSIFQDREGHLWFGTGGGVSRYDGQRFQTFTTQEGLANNAVHAILEDREGYLWFGTWGGGVSRYDGQQFTTFTTQDGLADNGIRSVFQDREGHLWFGTFGGGVSRYDGQRFQTFTTQEGLADNRVRSVFQDREGHLWFGTWGGGVSRYDGQRFQTFTTQEGLAGNWVWSIFQDRERHLWFGTEGGGVSRYDGQGFQTLFQKDGLSGNDVFGILQDQEGNLWFATSKGVTRFRPPPPSPPPVFIDAVVAGQRYEETEKVEIPSTIALVVFEFHGISFKTRPEAMVYRYRLKGYEEDWKNTHEQWVEYQGLPVGDYTFQVKAVDRDLTYSEMPTEVRITIHPPYGTIALASGLGLALVGLVTASGYGISRRRGQRQAERALLQEQQARLQAQEELNRELEKELQTAHEMQMALMPKEPPRIEGFEITGRCIPANHVGGDLFQYFHQHDRLSISLADVTGHAMEAAIPVVMFSGILKSQMGMGGTVEELFGKLNQVLHGTLTGHTLVCLAMGELDPATRRFRFSNAGCPYPYHYRAASGEVVELQMDAYPLGVRPDTTYRGAEVQLEPGDRVVFCSDGIAEAGNAAGEMFGFERTAETVRRGGAEDLSAEGLLARIIQEVKAFSGEVPQGDDQTVVVLKVDDRRSA